MRSRRSPTLALPTSSFFTATVAPSCGSRSSAAGDRGLIPEDLASGLALSAGLRNVLVHAYEEIDYEIVASSVSRALIDVRRFADILTAGLEEDD